MSTVLLSSKPTGTIVKIKENNIEKEFIVLKHGYPTEGNGRTLLLRKKAFCDKSTGGLRWMTTYGNSAVDTYLNSNYLNKIDANIQKHISEVTIPYTKTSVQDIGGHDETIYESTSLNRKVFVLSATEMGWTDTIYLTRCGTALSYFNSNASRICETDGDTAAYNNYETRCPHHAGSTYHWIIPCNTGSMGYAGGNIYYVRPAFTLPSTLFVLDNGAVTENSPPETPSSISHGTPRTGQSLTINCGASADADGDTIQYVWERRVDTGIYVQLGITSEAAITDTVPTSGTYYQVRVKAVDSNGLESEYITGSPIAIDYNKNPIISDTDVDLGASTTPLTYSYTVADENTEQVLTVTEKVSNGTETITLRSFTAISGAANIVDLSPVWLRLQAGAHTLTITVSDGVGGTAQRIITFGRTIGRLAASRAFSTDSKVTKCFISFYPSQRPDDANVCCEVSNNPFDAMPAWEDISAKLNLYVHAFANTTVATTNGFAYRFYIIKGTQRVEVDQVVVRFA